jgi:mono/diheme cytochrome c family protein
MAKMTGIVVAFALVFINATAFALPFNQDMVRNQLSIGDIQRPEPPHSVPRNSLQRKVVEKREDALSLVNPVKPSIRSIARGKRLYQSNCSVCHGRLIDGQHIKGAMQDKNGALPLFEAFMKEKSDGHFFQHIHFGLYPVMPVYGWRFAISEQWDIVNYIRKGQEERASSVPSSTTP